MKRKNQNKLFQLQERAFDNIFTSIQYCFWYVLYAPEHTMQFDKEQLIKYDKMIKESTDIIYGGEEYIKKTEKEIKEALDIDCHIESRRFPYHIKVAMAKT